MEASIPGIVAGEPSLIPPPLRPYFDGLLADAPETAWRKELLWYASLPHSERRLWDTHYNYSWVLTHSPRYASSPDAPATSISPEVRERLRSADRRMFVDFINALEGMPCSPDCPQPWRHDFWFWTVYVAGHLQRAGLYLEELSPEVSIELEQSNLDAVRRALKVLLSDVSSCRTTSASTLRGSIRSITGLIHLQRQYLLAMVDIREWNGSWNLPCEQ